MKTHLRAALRRLTWSVGLLFPALGFAAPPADGGAAAPSIFAPGVISGPASDADATFSPDGNTVVFARGGAIMVSRRQRSGWSQPELAPFSGEWRDQQPTMAPSGAFLVFVSNRPLKAGDTSHPAGNLWRVDRRGEAWGQPVHLPEAVNADNSIWAPSVAGDGSLYFIKRERQGAPLRLWRSQFRSGAYEPAVPISFGDTSTQDVDPAVAPDESFIVFGSMHPGPDAHERLYIAFKEGGGWSKPVDLGTEVNGDGSNDVNEARLGPDGRTLYFTTDRTTPLHFPRSRKQAVEDNARIQAWDNGTQNIWSVSLAPWLEVRKTR